VKAVLVIVGISEFDQVLREQTEVNRMHEALKLFGDVSNWVDLAPSLYILDQYVYMQL
jgi:hypothetical protein